MSKITDNTYTNKIQKEIIAGTFKTKEDLIGFLNSNRFQVMNDPFFRQELENSFIKLNEETIGNIEKTLLEFYDKRKNNSISSLNLDGVSSFEVDDKDYIKVVDKDGNIAVLDDSLNDNTFTSQFQDRQNDLSTANTLNPEVNKQEIIKDMSQDKMSANLNSSLDVNVRELSPEEKRQFVAVTNMPNADSINFLVDPSRNMYINKDNGDVYFVKKNEYGQLEVRKAEQITSTTTKEEDVPVIDDNQNETTVTVESVDEPKFDALSDSDLEYIYENRLASLNDNQKQKLIELIEKRKRVQQQNIEQNTNTSSKVFVKKIDYALHKPYNGFISLVFLCSMIGFSGLGFLLLVITNIQ